MYEISTESSFSAAHHLRNYSGPCENVHGHNWLVKAIVRCEQLDEAGLGIDFKILKSKLRDILAKLDHHDLNEVFAELSINPSSELIARYIFGRLRDELTGYPCKMHRVEVSETPGNCAAYME